LSFAVGIELPVTGAPSLQKAVEVCPSERVEFSPLADDFLCIELRVLFYERYLEGVEVVIEEG